MLDGREVSASGVKRPVQTAFNACEYSFYNNPQNCGRRAAARSPEILMAAIISSVWKSGKPDRFFMIIFKIADAKTAAPTHRL